MPSNFPKSIDNFPALSVNQVLDASTANNYTASIVQCQTSLKSTYSLLQSTSLSMFGAVFIHQITVDFGGSSFYPNIGTEFHRHKGHHFFPYGSLLQPNNFATLDFSTVSSTLFPNGQLFHANNMHFVTLESSQCLNGVGGTSSWDLGELSSRGNDKCGGSWLREGVLYHDGALDVTPQVVLADFMPLYIGHGDGSDNLHQVIYTVHIHFVCIG